MVCVKFCKMQVCCFVFKVRLPTQQQRRCSMQSWTCHACTCTTVSCRPFVRLLHQALRAVTAPVSIGSSIGYRQRLTSTISHHFAAADHCTLTFQPFQPQYVCCCHNVCYCQCSRTLKHAVLKRAVPSPPLRAPAVLVVLTPGIGNARGQEQQRRGP